MRVKFTKEFIKKVKASPDNYRDTQTILNKNNSHELKSEIKINGYLYKLGEEVELE